VSWTTRQRAEKRYSLRGAEIHSSITRVVGARVITFPVTAVCGLMWLRLVIGHFGSAQYALIAVVVGLQFLMVFLDFGTSAHVLEESGRYSAHKDLDGLGRALGRACRTIIIGNVAVFLAAVVLAVSGAWGNILGFPDQSGDAGLAVVMTFGINILARPLSLATPLAAGLGRPALATFCQPLASVVSLGAAAACVAFSAPLPFVTTTPVLGQLIAALPPLFISLRAAPGLLAASIRAVAESSGTGSAMRRLAVPMLVIEVVAPLNYQLDRIILSHTSTVQAVAAYALAAQLSANAQSIAASTLPALWAQFARIRATSGIHVVLRDARRYVRTIWPIVTVLGVAFCALSWVAAPIISAGEIHLSWSLCAVLGAALPLAAIEMILGVALSGPSTLRMTAAITVLTTGVNVGLSVFLAARYGAVGPAAASVLALVLQIGLLSLLAGRHLRVAASPRPDPTPARKRHQAAAHRNSGSRAPRRRRP
jgi:O-antigen/teichoic acid export membrane protein